MKDRGNRFRVIGRLETGTILRQRTIRLFDTDELSEEHEESRSACATFETFEIFLFASKFWPPERKFSRSGCQSCFCVRDVSDTMRRGNAHLSIFLDILNAEKLRENPTYTLESSTRSRNNKSRRGSSFIQVSHVLRISQTRALALIKSQTFRACFLFHWAPLSSSFVHRFSLYTHTLLTFK